jgi:hypothetical protein
MHTIRRKAGQQTINGGQLGGQPAERRNTD